MKAILSIVSLFILSASVYGQQGRNIRVAVRGVGSSGSGTTDTALIRAIVSDSIAGLSGGTGTTDTALIRTIVSDSVSNYEPYIFKSAIDGVGD